MPGAVGQAPVAAMGIADDQLIILKQCQRIGDGVIAVAGVTAKELRRDGPTHKMQHDQTGQSKIYWQGLQHTGPGDDPARCSLYCQVLGQTGGDLKAITPMISGDQWPLWLH